MPYFGYMKYNSAISVYILLTINDSSNLEPYLVNKFENSTNRAKNLYFFIIPINFYTIGLSNNQLICSSRKKKG